MESLFLGLDAQRSHASGRQHPGCSCHDPVEFRPRKVPMPLQGKIRHKLLMITKISAQKVRGRFQACRIDLLASKLRKALCSWTR